MTDTKSLMAHLRSGRQCDEEGVDCIVSRQACHEAADRIEALEAQLAEAERRGAERMRERAQQVVWDIQERNYTLAVAMTVSKAIRALPLTEGGE